MLTEKNQKFQKNILASAKIRNNIMKELFYLVILKVALFPYIGDLGF